MKSVLYREVIPFSEGPLSEAALYTQSIFPSPPGPLIMHTHAPSYTLPLLWRVRRGQAICDPEVGRGEGVGGAWLPYHLEGGVSAGTAQLLQPMVQSAQRDSQWYCGVVGGCGLPLCVVNVLGLVHELCEY